MYRRLRKPALATPLVAWIVMRLAGLGPYCDPSGNTCSRFEEIVGSIGTVAFVVLWFTAPFVFFLALYEVAVAAGRLWRRARRAMG
jgi:hypothetical protein